MIWQLDIIVLSLLVICAFAAISLKDLLSAAIVFGAYSFLMCLLWTEMGAVDVAFTEAAVGAGVSTVFFVAAVFRSNRLVTLRKSGRVFFKLLGLLVSSTLGCILFFAANDFPSWADPNSPASIHVSPYYITKTIEDTSVPNIVTSVLADYRGFDTMFETAVVFVAGIAVFLILRSYRKEDHTCELDNLCPESAKQSSIVKTISRIMVPFMQLFALYVVAHGHHSPGGGFQGGVILGASFILLGVSYDLGTILERMSEKWNLLLANLGISIYAGIGVICLFLGANFLDYSIYGTAITGISEIEARSHGMLGVEIGVAFTVMAIMVAIYANIASHGRYDKGL